ncbi:unnamed protein product, partial [marine sediment metagenome]
VFALKAPKMLSQPTCIISIHNESNRSIELILIFIIYLRFAKDCGNQFGFYLLY